LRGADCGLETLNGLDNTVTFGDDNITFVASDNNRRTRITFGNGNVTMIDGNTFTTDTPGPGSVRSANAGAAIIAVAAIGNVVALELIEVACFGSRGCRSGFRSSIALYATDWRSYAS
jgi:hypothetical protein